MIEVTQQTIHLSIETTGRQGSIALLRGLEPIRFTNLSSTSRTAATLAPELDQTLKWCRESDTMPKFLSVADGPGSFTGLRIGVTTAKSLSYGLGLPLIAVDSLASIAAAAMNETPTRKTVSVSLDAYRNQVYAGLFNQKSLLPEFDSIPQGWSTHPPSVHVLQTEAWDTELANLPDDVGVAGDAKTLGHRAGAAMKRQCDAIGTGLLGLLGAHLGQWVNPLQLAPRYLKPSAAEEKAAAGKHA
ncbi:tRNA (adenosine(37)-N6)-threonylcarbamoyltransferase complex dimerization subunit type 1 TsaB [Rubripirellula sp.]|nr:tRNA (adenosine(37)-N6)-threonylcarbamoyltransferase complex dimerization subunit type 1 TsaB [Rubripirellula sp.]MDF1845067.1 tRNA (adenosine(37)-N6)-threonylcarbamoyltransferase complex dimerization subunit type 1 TsaB [Rubripirellula sp.]